MSAKRVGITPPSNDNAQSSTCEIVRGLRLAARQLWLLADERQREAGAVPVYDAAEVAGDGPASTPEVLLRAVERELRLLRARDRDMPVRLFREPAWDLLLCLYAAQLRDRSICLSSLALASELPASAASRALETLADAGLVFKSEPQGGKRVRWLYLTAEGKALVENHILRAIDRTTLTQPVGRASAGGA